jgi:soluble lytic murein transglycosylase
MRLISLVGGWLLRRVGLALFFLLVAVVLTPAIAAERILSDADTLLMRGALKAAAKQHWKTVRSRASRVRNPIARKLITWRRLTGDGVTPTFDEAEKFLVENPDWPRHERLLRRAEQALPVSWKAERVVSWFGTREPLSALGAARLGAAEQFMGETEKGLARIRGAWIEGDFSRAQSRAFYKRFRKILTPADHLARLDRLLWDGRHSAARRLLPLVDKSWQRLAQARIALRRRAGNVDALIKRVPEALKSHAGLVYERLRWRRRKNLDTALELAKTLEKELPQAEMWWEERAILARRALRKGHVTDAYHIAKNNGLLPGGASHAEAEWLSGWIALRFLKDHDAAFQHFKRMHGAVKYPVSIARGAYWAGRAKESGGHMKRAVHWFGKAADHPLTYYGQLAFARLWPGKSLKLPSAVDLSEASMKVFDNHEIVKVIRILGDLAAHDLVRYFIRSLMVLSEDPQWWARTAQLARLSGRPDLSIRIANKADRNGTPLLRNEAFPILTLPKLPKTATSSPPEVSLALAMIRQESAFRITARSHAGAQGLMQIMPATAKVVSKGLKMRYSRLRLVTSPEYNMTLGQSYLGDLLKQFRGSYVLALVGYNAGPHRARRWIKSHGDPRNPDVDAVDWVEIIPFDETRDYVQRVLENLQIYRLVLSKAEVALGLEGDLHLSHN